jgi:hypothetical protein
VKGPGNNECGHVRVGCSVGDRNELVKRGLYNRLNSLII